MIFSPIKPNETGFNAVNLIDALLFLHENDAFNVYDPPESPNKDELFELAEKARAEREQQVFGDASQRLVFYFQLQAGIGDHLGGEVDDATAAHLNKRLEALGAFGTTGEYEVFGIVHDADAGKPAQGIRIVAYDMDFNRATPLGEAHTDSDGRYRIAFTDTAFRESPSEQGGPELVVRAFDEAGLAIGKSKLVRNAGLRTELSFAIDARWRVQGMVTDRDGRPVPHINVVAIDRDLRTSQFLGEAQTGADGRYEIRYRPSAFASAEADTPLSADLMVAAMSADAQEPLAVSAIRFHAQALETIDVTIDALASGATEFERIGEAVRPLLRGQGGPSLQMASSFNPNANAVDLAPEALMGSDIEFIHRETGLDAAAVEAWASAARANAEALRRFGDGDAKQRAALKDHGWPFLFAMFRAGRASDLDDVLTGEAEDWRETQAGAETMRRIPPVGEVRREALFAALATLAVLAKLDVRYRPNSPLAQVLSLAAAPLPPAVGLRALEIESKSGIDDPDAFLALANDHPDAMPAIEGVVRSMRLYTLTDGDLPLAQAIATKLGQEGHSLAPLAALPLGAWQLTIAQAMPGVGADDTRVKTQALALQNRIEQTYALPALSERLDNGVVQIALPGHQHFADTVRQHGDVVDVLLKNGRLQAGQENVLPKDVADTVRNLGRYSREGFVFSAAADLINHGIASPGAAVQYGPDVLHQILENLYDRERIDNATWSMHQRYKNGRDSIETAIVDFNRAWPGLGAQPLPPEVRENLPTLRGLFGELDECVCRPCESVLGLPAYFVDLLNLLKTVPLKPGSTVPYQGAPATAQSVLRKRRPDLFNLPLSCENADTEVAHIDLALEVLQEAVAQDTGHTQSADVVLREALFPWGLPFDRGAFEAQAALHRLQSSRGELQALTGAVTSNAAAAAVLGIAMPQQANAVAEWTVIAASRSGADLWAAWGLSLGSNTNTASVQDPSSGAERSGPPADILGWASVLMQRTGLELDGLEQALATRWVGGLALAGRDQCKPSQMQLPTRTETVYDRLHRFVRLWRKLPAWSAALADSALASCHAPGTASSAWSLGDSALQALAVAEQARVALALAPEELLALRMDPAQILVRDASHSGGAVHLLDHVFGWRAQTSATTLSAVLDRIAASLGADSRELAALIAQGAVQDALTPTHLTWLYRHALLARALGLRIGALRRLLAATGLQPFEPVSATLSARDGFQRLLDLATAAGRVGESGLAPAFLASALLPAAQFAPSDSGEGSAPKTAETLTAELSSLRDALRAAADTDAGATLEQRANRALARVLGAADAERVLAAVRAAAAATQTTVEARALAALTRQANANPGPRALGQALPLFDAAQAASPQLLGAAATNPSLDSRLTLILERIAEREREQRLLAALQTTTGLPEAVVADLLNGGLEIEPAYGPLQWRKAADVLLAVDFWGLAAPALSETARPELYVWMHRLDRLGAAFTHFASLPELPGLLARIKLGAGTPRNWNWRMALAPRTAPSAGWTPPWSDWRELIDLAWLAQPEQLSAATLTALYDGLDRATSDQDAVAALAERLEIARSEVLALAAQTTAQTTAQLDRDALRRPSVLRRVVALALRLRALRATAAQLPVLMNVGDNASAAQTARALLQAKLGEHAAGALTAIDDRLRIRRRDALVAWLMHRRKLRSADELYAHYLIDTQIQPCFRTTRILQAAASVQLFIQRILHGIEPDLLQGGELKRRWSWMRNYRVWEANRKVFLFPENWLFPELRDDKSFCFTQLEAALGTGELNGDAANDAFGRFLGDIAASGQIQVLGMYEDIERAPAAPFAVLRRNLYLVGRTPNPPYLYFWRKCADFGQAQMEWTPWQRIELDIQGDHVMPFVLGHQLRIAWPMVERHSEAGSRQWRIGLAVSKFNGKQWERAQISRDPAVISAHLATKDPRESLAFRLALDPASKDALVRCYVARTVPQTSAAAPTGNTIAATTRPLTAFPTTRPASGTYRVHHSSGPILPVPNDQWPPTYAVVGDSASRILTWECWVKVKSDNGTSVIPLSRVYPGHTMTLIDDANTLEPIDLAHWRWRQIGFGGGSSPATARLEYGFVPEARLRLRANFVGDVDTTVSSIDPILVPRVNTGNEDTVVLKFVLDASGFTAEQLGLVSDQPKLFQCASQFRVRLDDTLQVEPYNDRLTKPRGTEPWLNGYREIEASTTGYNFEAPVANGQNAVALRTIVSGTMQNAFFVLPANSSRMPHEIAGVWYFGEAGGQGVIDADTGTALFRILPTHYPESQRVLQRWYGQQDIRDPALQRGTFGADLLPAPGPFVAADTWRKTPNGGLDVAAQSALFFDQRLPNACYNWEVFFHAPLLIADQLSKQQKFEDAERWLRYVFDPTSGEPGADAKRFLRFRVFKELDPSNDVAALMSLLARAAGRTATNDELGRLRQSIERWRDLPFRPFSIARRRHLAFLWRTLFAYLDNLLAWADSLYRRDTREAIGEATLLYVLAARILGPRPRVHTGGAPRPASSYDAIVGSWDEFSNLWIDTSPPQRHHRHEYGNGSLFVAEHHELPSTQGFLYFCIPFNDKLFGYWNTVESRLFNIRHCRNLDGVARDLPLTDPPIDPELLIRATAAGLDLGEVVAGLYAPPPSYRFTLLSARASELASEVRSLGAAMLSAIEKRDAEDLSLLRASNEIALMQRIGEIRQLQIEEANRNIDALRATRAMTAARYEQYQRLLGRDNPKAPPEQQTAGEESALGRKATGNSNAASNLGLLDQESKQIEYLGHAYGWSLAAGVTKGIAGATHMSSSIVLAAMSPVPPSLNIPSEILKAIGTGISTTGEMFELVSRGWQHGANHESLMAGHLRRRDEWAFQSNQSLRELAQIDRQIVANEIRIQLARKELGQQRLQIEQAEGIDAFLRRKYSNSQLYDWMVSQLSALHTNAYRMALEMARRAEHAARRELAQPGLSVVRNDHWNSLRSGLLAGERLHQDIKRLDVAYLDQNRREYELTKHVSLMRLDPMALLALKAHGHCEFDVPEWLFDMDTPGHYMRRVKSVSLSIPCVVGPYAGVHCKLTLLRNSMRHSADTAGGYLPAVGADDPRFTVRYGATESIVTSTAREDSGLFETALRDERYLPFENAGAIARWRLELPGQTPQFQIDTLSDAILHIRYTARDGGDGLRSAAESQWAPPVGAPPAAATAPGPYRLLLSARHDFPGEWAAATSGPNPAPLRIALATNVLPYWMQALRLNNRKVSTLVWPSSLDPLIATERWPSGQPPLALSNGAGTADFGPIPAQASDVYLLLEVG
jgi:5-hydroxyisourate hydrolase-like protein (transthyretin family)